MTVTDEMVRAFNMIDVIFHDEKKVRDLWHEYYDMLNDPTYRTDAGFKQQDEQRRKLISEIAKVLGYGKEISTHDINRVYIPEGLAQSAQRTEMILNVLLDVLKAIAAKNVNLSFEKKGGDVTKEKHITVEGEKI